MPNFPLAKKKTEKLSDPRAAKTQFNLRSQERQVKSEILFPYNGGKMPNRMDREIK
jgi:hypothetical protein